MAQGLLKGFNAKNSASRYYIQKNISKAFDSLNRDYVSHMLRRMGFKDNFTIWVFACILSLSFATMVNGEPPGLFGSSRGLKKGDSLSPMLLVITMEGLTTLLEYAETEGKIKALGKYGGAVNHLFIADEVMIFSGASVNYVKNIDEVLLTFSKAFRSQSQYSED